MRGVRWIALVCALAGPPAAEAADKTIGVIMSGNIVYYQEVHKAFAAAIAQEGFGPGAADTILQMPSPEPMSWTNAARKLAAADVNVLVIYGAPATLAAIQETRAIPIVFAGVYDPVAVGVQARNAMGISAKTPMTSLLKYLKKLMAFSRIAVIYSEAEPDSVRQVEDLHYLEQQYGFTIVKMPIRRPDDVKRLSFQGKADVVFISSGAAVNETLDSIVQKCRDAKVPAISQMSGTAERGILLSLSPSAAEQGQTAARIAARLLRGEKPPAITVEMPKRVELVVNVKEAGSIGLAVPFDVLSDATRVIK